MERREVMRPLYAKLLLAAFSGAVLFTLPPDAKVTAEGVPGQGWLQTGDMSCSFMAACRQWEAVMGRQGWKKQNSFRMPNARQVFTWKKNKHNITLLIWEKDIGQSGFSWGEHKDSKQKSK